ncbi:MAG TPA: adenylate/guanylate cyclase domain-containing protein [Rhodocyclaceae bacterium]|nr:adenylate/guanylate cyclase domain-containing protein [Rhodocyclaceae bacterium]
MSASILFSDVSGSTRMYEVQGDVAAQRMIDRALHEMSRIVANKSGRVIKTLGDEVMALFSDPGDALWAACDMQQAMHERGNRPSLLPVSLHIGIHSGAVIVEGGDAFGDAVNIAARITSLAKPEQILTTAETIKAAGSRTLPNFRRLATIPLRGREAPVELREILWTNPDPDAGIDELTVLEGMPSSLARTADVPALTLSSRGNSLEVSRLRPRIAIGRDPASDLVVSDPLASRTHAVIEMRGDKFILIDQSSNGTYVTPRLDTATKTTISLRREECILSGEGRIRLGHNKPDSPWFVAYVTG